MTERIIVSGIFRLGSLTSPATVAIISNPRKETNTMPVVAIIPLGPVGANGSRLDGSIKNRPSATAVFR
jgi:hypothetical protein